VRAELVYVAASRRRECAGRLLERFVAPGGRLIICSHGSSRPEGGRAGSLVEELRDWGVPVHRVDDAVSPEHGFVITRVVSVPRAAGARQGVAAAALGSSTSGRWTARDG
jgi:hypothetical protein